MRYLEAVDEFVNLYGDRDNVRLFTAPGRTEIGGNHTDHQHGLVLAGSVNLDIIAIPGFGEFEALRKEEYISVDDATGKKVLYPPCIEVNFNASSLLKKKMID